MKMIDRFLWEDICKVFRKSDIAFYVDDIKTYNKAMASIRMRCYDIIEYLEALGIHAELYKPFKKYKAVIFTKTSTDRSVRMAHKLHGNGVKIYYESHCEYLTDAGRLDREKENILKTLEAADIVGTSSDVQQRMFGEFHNHVLMIPESVHGDFFLHSKTHESKKRITLVYCGYSGKASDTLCIAKVIQRLQQEFGVEMLYICEKDPEIREFPNRYLFYDQRKIPELLMEGDIMIAPRPMEGIENRAHSFTKAAYPLAVGLPTVASPMPSYRDTPVILCTTEIEWYRELSELIRNTDKRKRLGAAGRTFVKEHYSMDTIGKRYLDILREFGVIEN